MLDEYGLGAETEDLNRRAAEIARSACDAFATPGDPRWVIGSIGPGTRSPTIAAGAKGLGQELRRCRAMTSTSAGFILLFVGNGHDGAGARRTSESARDGAAASALGVDTDTYHLWYYVRAY